MKRYMCKTILDGVKKFDRNDFPAPLDYEMHGIRIVE